jgi:hypothetical protein
MKSWLMMMSVFFILKASAEVSLQQKHPLEGFAIISDAVPVEVELMLGHLKSSELEVSQIQKILSYTGVINQELALTPVTNIMFLLKSEIYRAILNNQYLRHGNILQISTSILENTKQKLQKHNVVYTQFSKWIIESILSDFDSFLEKNFINTYQNISANDNSGQLKVARLNKILKYTSPWLNAIDYMSPEDFNSLCTNVIIDALESISRKTFYFKTYTNILSKNESQSLFAIPEVKIEKAAAASIESPATLKEESESRKEIALETVKDLDAQDLSPISPELGNIEVPSEDETTEAIEETLEDL